MSLKKNVKRLVTGLPPLLLTAACCYKTPAVIDPVTPPKEPTVFEQAGCEGTGRPAGPAISGGTLLGQTDEDPSGGFASDQQYLKQGTQSYAYDALGATQALACEGDGNSQSFSFSARSLSLGEDVDSLAAAIVPYNGVDISSAGERPTVSAVIDGGRLGIYPVKEGSCREGDLSTCAIADDFIANSTGNLDAKIDYTVIAGSFGAPRADWEEISSIRLSLVGAISGGSLNLSPNVADGVKLNNFRKVSTGGNGAFYIWDTTTISSEIPPSLGNTISLEASIRVNTKSELICNQLENCLLVVASFSDPWPDTGSSGVLTFSSFDPIGNSDLQKNGR